MAAADPKSPISVKEAIRTCLKKASVYLVVEAPSSLENPHFFPLGTADEDWAIDFIESHPETKPADKEQWIKRAAKKQSIDEVKSLLTKRGLTLADLGAEEQPGGARVFGGPPLDPGGAKRALEGLVALQQGAHPNPNRSPPRSDARPHAQTA